MYAVIDQSDWTKKRGKWRGEVQLGAHGGNLCPIFNLLEPGGGPRLHRHPYSETFIIKAGRAVFTVGDETVEASAGRSRFSVASVVLSVRASTGSA